ncbi:erythrocyte membrane protein 1, PfEMP1, putative [Plasmodium reichenowi]|uniref:Erythrocyte membrane protein 1, PfEMP1, putative n=1 Tax=Plasmodium reichenowi TaxID=5854 RepID=A0A2P9DSK1_PLARE|nr:erythrocyte membrane protein 1, PfEMP1, putative [Plasmodium reichenowi]
MIIPTLKSKIRYVPYRSAQYRGKRYIYLEGDSGTDSGYTDHYSDITSSSEKVVLEPSKRDTQNGDIPSDDIQNDDIPNEFISQYLPNIQPNDIPNNNISATIPKIPIILPRHVNNVDNKYHPTPVTYIVDNNTHPTPSRHNVDNNTPSKKKIGKKKNKI